MMCVCQHCHGSCGREATTEIIIDGVVTPVCELCRHELDPGCGWQATRENWTVVDDRAGMHQRPIVAGVTYLDACRCANLLRSQGTGCAVVQEE